MGSFEAEFETNSTRESNSDDHQPTHWQLSRVAFDGLLAQFSSDRVKAGEEYLLLRKNLVRFFESRKIAEANEATDEVLDRLARKIQNGEVIEKLASYACGIARLVALENYKKPIFQELPDNLNESDKFATRPDSGDEKETKLRCLEVCLSELSEENRQVVLSYYEGDGRNKIENRQKLGAKLGIPQNALCKRVIRLREKLEKCVARC